MPVSKVVNRYGRSFLLSVAVICVDTNILSYMNMCSGEHKKSSHAIAAEYGVKSK